MNVSSPVREFERIGHYQLLEKRGAGGMGAIYKALDLTLNRTVALKFLALDEPSRAAHERLLREARASSILDHENIATVHSVEESSDGQLFLVMTFYEGETLAERLRRGPLATDRVIEIAVQIARGLRHAHLHGILHGDIKPSNIILTPEGLVKIVDFGLAHHLTPSATTQSSHLSGTLAYMSPEHVMMGPLDGRSDLWSVGVVLYEMLTGCLPFSGENPAAILNAIVNGAPAPIENLPHSVQLVVYRALAKEPGRRFQNCSELLHALERLAVGLPAPTISVTGTGIQNLIRDAAKAAAASGFSRPRMRSLAIGLAVVLAVVSLWHGPIREPGQPGSTIQANTHAAAYAYYEKGRAYLERPDRRGNIDRSVLWFHAAIQNDPNFALAYAALGDAFWFRYRDDRNPKWLEVGEKYSRRAIELNDQLAIVHIALGRLHAAAGESDIALQEFQRGLALEPHNPEALRGLASIYAERDRIAEANDLYRQAITLQPASWIAHIEYDIFLYRQRDFAGAAQQAAAAVELTPDNAIARIQYAIVLQELGRLDEAEMHLRKSIEIQPSYRGYTMLGRLYYHQRRWRDSAAFIEQALAFENWDYRVWANLGAAYSWLQDSRKAEKAYAQELSLVKGSLGLHPKDPEIMSEAALLYARQHDRDLSVPLLEAALARGSKNLRVLQNAAEAYEQLGNRRRAVALLKIAFKIGESADDIGRNPGLTDLRRDRRYQDLVAAYPATRAAK